MGCANGKDGENTETQKRAGPGWDICFLISSSHTRGGEVERAPSKAGLVGLLAGADRDGRNGAWGSGGPDAAARFR